MIKSRYVVAGFLLLMSLLAVTQTVQSQQYTTATLTTFVTSNETGTSAVSTQVMTTTAGQVTPVYVGGPVTILGTHGVCGEYFEQTFDGVAGQVLTGSVSASSTVNVYVMTTTGFQAWQHQVVAGGTCTPASPVSSQNGATSYTLSTPIPVTGGYELIVHNLSESTVTVQIVANLIQSAPNLATVVFYSTVTQQMVQTLMQTSVQTLQTTSSSPDMTTLSAIIGVIIIIAAAAYVAKVRKSKTEKK